MQKKKFIVLFKGQSIELANWFMALVKAHADNDKLELSIIIRQV